MVAHTFFLAFNNVVHSVVSMGLAVDVAVNGFYVGWEVGAVKPCCLMSIPCWLLLLVAIFPAAILLFFSFGRHHQSC